MGSKNQTAAPVIFARCSEALREGVKELAHCKRKTVNQIVCELLRNAVMLDADAARVYHAVASRDRNYEPED